MEHVKLFQIQLTSIIQLKQQFLIQSMNSLQNLNRKLHLLESKHEQMEENLKEQIQFLHMNLNILRESAQFSLDVSNQSLIDFLLASQVQITSSFTEQLLNNQVQVQQQCEMMEIIKNYQRRISDLRAHLINKEAEISYWTYDVTIESILKRQNIQQLNIEGLEKQTIRKNLMDYKKICVEVEALEHTLQIYSSQKRKSLNQQSEVNKNKIFSQPFHQKQIIMTKVVVTAQQKSNNTRKQLLNQVINLFKEQVQRESNQKKELAKLKCEWQKINSSHKQLTKQYQNANISKSRVTRFENNSPNIKQNGKKQMSFLSFLESNNGDDQIVCNEPFAKKNANIQQISPNKAEKPRKTYLRRQNKTNAKQN